MAIRKFEHHTPQLAPRVYVDETALVLGQVSIGEDSSVWPMAVARGDVHHIEIGARTNIQDGSVLHVTHDSEYEPNGSPLIIGNDVTVGHKVILHACVIHDRCLIGMGAIVMDDAIIQSDVILGAGSLVPPHKELESGYLYLGSPARKIRPLTEHELKFLPYSAKHYVALKNRHLASR
jgi:carbonic anhydrase/acetyltransferase-like protein (isoleucine patch superfamily)